MNEVLEIKLSNDGRITSVELCELINMFRLEEGNVIEKKHDDLLKSIRKEIEELSTAGISLGNFSESIYTNSRGKTYPCFLCNDKGVLEILNKESAVVRYKTVEYIEKLQNQLKKKDSYMISDPIERARRWIEEQEEKKLLESKVTEMQPKAEFFDAVAGSKDAIEIGKVAKVLNYPGIGRNKLFEILREKGILMKDNVPYQKYIDNGCFRTVEQKFSMPDGEIRINIKTLVYQKDIDYIRKVLEVV